MSVLTIPTRVVEYVPETLSGISYEEFLDLGEDYNFAEWVDGEVIKFMSVRFEHQAIVNFLIRLIGEYVELFGLGIVQSAPFQMRLARSGREPDVMFLSNERRGQITSRYLLGAADLAIEVISPESVRRDTQNKFREYQEAGIQEYWIIDSREGQMTADFYVLNAVGRYQKQASERSKRFHSTVIDGFWIDPAWLWQTDQLSAMDCLLQIDGVITAMQAKIDRAKQ